MTDRNRNLSLATVPLLVSMISCAATKPATKPTAKPEAAVPTQENKDKAAVTELLKILSDYGPRKLSDGTQDNFMYATARADRVNLLLSQYFQNNSTRRLIICERILSITEETESTPGSAVLETRCYLDGSGSEGPDGNIDMVHESQKKDTADFGYEQRFLISHGADALRRCSHKKRISDCVTFRPASAADNKGYRQTLRKILQRHQQRQRY